MTENRHAFRIRSDMRRGWRSEVPLPTRLVSNEEFPRAATDGRRSRPVEHRILAEAERPRAAARARAAAISCGRAAAWRRRSSP